MKKYFVAISIVSFIAACGNGGNSDNGANDSALNSSSTTATGVSTNPDYQKGLELIAKSDCLTCHKPEEKVTGPSYREVANKYAGADTAVKYLAGKIIRGGSGVWGSIAMTPHQISQEDAEQMVKYILLLKNSQ